jgi:outer membrane protein OmpA-like peptidoglycan-associated protein
MSDAYKSDFEDTHMNTFKLNQYLLGGALAFGMMACATGPKTNTAIEEARAAIEQVERHPMAGEVALTEVDAARVSLREAESLAKDRKSEKDINNAAYIAKRHAQVAEEQIKVAEAKKSQEAAASERQAIVLDAREREATIQADDARMKAQDAENKARDLQAQDAANKERIALLEKQLADLNVKKTERGLVLTLGDVLFDTAQATLKAGAVPTIERLGDFLKDAQDRSVQIEGHTDSVGEDSYNQELSARRADAVKQALLSRGISSDRIQTVGKGENLPIASNDSAGGRQQNRRVEIIINDPERDASVTR